MPFYEVWMEGYSATGNHAPDKCLGVYKAKTFKAACKKALKDNFSEDDIKRYYNSRANTFWGCRFYDHCPHNF
jgi:hypothetical protein